MKRWADKTEIAIRQLVDWLGITRSKYYSWRERYGRLNEHNGSMPRDHGRDTRKILLSGCFPRSWGPDRLLEAGADKVIPSPCPQI